MKKPIAILVSAILVLSLSVPALADVPSAKLVVKDGKPVSTWTQRDEDKAYAEWLRTLDNNREGKAERSGDFVILGELPEDGEVDIQDYYFGTGKTILDSARSGLASANWNVVMYMAEQVFSRTFGGIILDIGQLVFGYANVNMNQGASAHLFHSHRYVTREASCWNSVRGTWELQIQENNREWYRHEFASFVGADGIAYTDSFDFTPPNGYGPVRTDVAPHFYDTAWLNSMAYEQYVYNRPVLYEYGW